MAANLVYMAKSAWQDLLASIKTKAGYVGTLTASQAKTAVDSIQTGGGGGPDSYVAFEYNANHLPVSAVVHGMSFIQERQFKGMATLEDVQIDDTVHVIRAEAFINCGDLLELKFPGAINDNIGSAAFRACSYLEEIDMNTGPYATISANVFYGCFNLNTLILRGSTMVTASASSAFTNTGLSRGNGTVYVPQALITEYQEAANWSALYAAGTQFVAIEGSIYE